MRLLKVIFLISALCCSTPIITFAYSPQEGNVSALIGPYFYKTNFHDTSSGAKSPLFASGGLILNGDISDKGALEVALFQMHKVFLREQGSMSLNEETSLIQINMGYRRWLSELTSASLTFYSAYAMGDPKIVHSDFPSGQNIDTSARDLTEYGFDFSIQQELWTSNDFSVIFDGRYSLSVTNKPKEKSDHYGALIGLRYFIQGKSPKSSHQ